MDNSDFSLGCRSGADERRPALAMERFDAFMKIVECAQPAAAMAFEFGHDAPFMPSTHVRATHPGIY
jgi:hypothetical protein